MVATAVPGTEPVDHEVRFYRAVGDLADEVGAYLAGATTEGSVAVLASGAANTPFFLEAIARAGIDPDAARRDGSLVGLDAEDVADRIVRARGATHDVFRKTVAESVRDVDGGGRHVRGYGESVGGLWVLGFIAGDDHGER